MSGDRRTVCPAELSYRRTGPVPADHRPAGAGPGRACPATGRAL